MYLNFVLTGGRYSDRKGDRCRYVVSSLFVGIVGFLLAMSTMNVTIRYFSLYVPNHFSFPIYSPATFKFRVHYKIPDDSVIRRLHLFPCLGKLVSLPASCEEGRSARADKLFLPVGEHHWVVRHFPSIVNNYMTE